jgi:hypothetical protein
METSFTGEDRCTGIPVQYHLDNLDRFAGNCMIDTATIQDIQILDVRLQT